MAKYNDGDIHPKNPSLVWNSSVNNGKGDWRKVKVTTTTVTKTPMTDPVMIKAWAQNATEQNLLTLAQSKNGPYLMRKTCYDELESRGYDMSTVSTAGTLDKMNKLIGSNSTSDEDDDAIAPISPNAHVTINGQNGSSDGVITEKWYLNPNDKRVKSSYDLSTKGGRIRYDKFVDGMKRKEPKYKAPIKIVQGLNAEYIEFITNEEQRFMISAGGAGIGKSYGFNELAKIENKKPFSEGMTPGDADYDIFESKDVGSGKQLINILKQHNGKIILFDDTDKVLTLSTCASVMKKATDSNAKKRMIGDSDDPTKNFEFTGRIIVMTNKNLSELATEDEDTKAILSRAMMVSEIYLTVPETIEVIEKRFQDYEFPQAPRLDDAGEDKKEREEILDLIKTNQDNIDPANFTTRTFQNMIIKKRTVEKANEKKQNPAYAAFLGTDIEDWREGVEEILTKGNEDELSLSPLEILQKGVESEELIKAIMSDDDEMTIEKAEKLLFED